MITIGSFKDISNKYDECWLIVRSLKSIPSVEGTEIFHVPVLSPSVELFHEYIQWRDMGLWNADVFKNNYVPKFLQEMNAKDAQQTLRMLLTRGLYKNILLACYCENEALCHRSIVFGLLQGINNTWTDSVATPILQGSDYSFYYDLFKSYNNLDTEEPFYLLVAGSRTFDNYPIMALVTDWALSRQVRKNRKIIIVSGGAHGADTLAERYARERGYQLHVMPADWKTYGKSAGYRRNNDMHEYIKQHEHRGVLCFWDLQSRGTQHNFKLSLEGNTPLIVYDYTNNVTLTNKQIYDYAYRRNNG